MTIKEYFQKTSKKDLAKDLALGLLHTLFSGAGMFITLLILAAIFS